MLFLLLPAFFRTDIVYVPPFFPVNYVLRKALRYLLVGLYGTVSIMLVLHESHLKTLIVFGSPTAEKHPPSHLGHLIFSPFRILSILSLNSVFILVTLQAEQDSPYERDTFSACIDCSNVSECRSQGSASY